MTTSTPTPTPTPTSTPTKQRMRKCVKCGQKKPLSEFGTNSTSADGLQTYCKACKNNLGKRRREENVSARLKHHISTRVATQLGASAPPELVKNLENHIGYKFSKLAKFLRERLREEENDPKRSLRDALNEGYHIDHIKPLHSFHVLQGPNSEVNWEIFKECWAMENLRAIPAEENLAKGGKWDGE